LGPGNPWLAVTPIAAQHEATDSLALDGVAFGNEFRVRRHSLLADGENLPFSSASYAWYETTAFGCSFGRQWHTWNTHGIA
jgi:hypothetical protein